MKRTLQVLLAATFVIGSAAMSLAQMTKGVIVYDMIMSSDDPQMQMGLQMMEGTTMTLTFDGDKYKSDMQSPMMIQKVISDGDQALQLMEMAGMRIATPMSMDELKEQNKKQRGGDDDEDVEVEKTNETKDIEGYTCKKVIVKSDKGESILWVTEEIQVDAEGSQFTSDEIDGFALEIETISERNGAEMKVVLTATSIKEKIKDKDPFNMEIPKGYMEKSLEELEKMQRGMRGGQ